MKNASDKKIEKKRKENLKVKKKTPKRVKETQLSDFFKFTV